MRAWKFATVVALVGAALAWMAPNTRAQELPAGDIHLICGFPAGTGADTIVRFYAEKLRPLTGRTIVVENKPGAGGNIAIEYVAKSKPDGLTILITDATSLASNMHLFKRPPVESVNAFQLLGSINHQAFMLAVDAKKPWTKLSDLTTAVKSKGEKATYATTAPPSVVMAAIYKAGAGLDAVEVNYKRSSDTVNDLLSGAVDYAVIEPVFATAQHRQGTLRVLAVSSTERLAAAPDLPTMNEQGIPMKLDLWWSGMVPAKTPRPVVEQLHKWFNQITASEDAKKFLNTFASDPWMVSPDEAQAELQKEVKSWGDFMRIAKIEPQG